MDPWPEPPSNRAAEIYSQIPSPPRVLIPPAARESSDRIHAHIANQTAADLQANSFAHTDVLTTIRYDDDFYSSGRATKEWKYEWRREAQSILPFLFLGPASAARDQHFLKDQGITMVLACRDISSAQANLLVPRVAAELGLECRNIDVAGNQGLIAAFPRAIDAINWHLSQRYQASSASVLDHACRPSVPGKVLVFCETGNERSTAVVTAYLMAMFSLPFVQAFQLIQSHRFCISFDDAARQLLKTYETILQARRDVAKGSVDALAQEDSSLRASRAMGNDRSTSLLEAQTLKRSHRDALTEAESASQQARQSHEEMDLDRFVGRSGPAPFYDSP